MSFIKAVRLEEDTPPPKPVESVVRGSWEPTALALAALNAEVAQVRGAAEGTRNETLNKAALNLAQLAAGGQIAWERVQDELVRAGLDAGLGEREVARTIRSGFAKGQQRARFPTPATSAFPPVAPSVAGPTAAGAPSELPAAVEIAPLDWDAVWANESDLEWILEPLIPAGRLIALYSPPKVGKSLLLLELAVAISNGRDALGAPTRATRVLYVDFENDPQTDVKARLIAMGYGPDDLRDLVYLSYPALPPLDTPQGAETLLRLVQKHECGLVVIDTISRAIQGLENDNDTWLNVYRYTGLAMKRQGCALLRLDHTGKDETKGQRGGSAKGGDVDALWKLSEVIPGTTYRLDCELQRIHIQENALTLTRELRPLKHKVATTHLSEMKREAIMRVLDEAGLPRDVGRDVAARAIKAAGIRVRASTLAEIIKHRKGGAEDWAPPVPGPVPD